MTEISIIHLLEDNLSEVTRIHIAAFPNSALGKLGTSAVKRYYSWQLFGPHDAIALGIFQGEILVGYCFAGLFHGSLSGFLRKNRVWLIWRVVTHPWLLGTPLFRDRLKSGWSILNPRSTKPISKSGNQARSFGVLVIAIKPQFQGEGLGRQLMLETEKIARERGFTQMHLTVATDNLNSIAFYEKMDWHKIPAADNVWRGSMVKELIN